MRRSTSLLVWRLCCCLAVISTWATATAAGHGPPEVGEGRRQQIRATTTTMIRRVDGTAGGRPDARQRWLVGQQHRKLAFWGWTFLANLVHCPPFGKKHDECIASRSSGGGSSSSNASDVDGDVDADSVESKSAEEGTVAGSGVIGSSSNKTLQIILWVAAAVAAALAMAAMYYTSQRRGGQHEKSHALSGSVARRMNLFGALCSVAAFRCGRPTRHAETPVSAKHGGFGGEHNNNNSDYQIMSAGGDGDDPHQVEAAGDTKVQQLAVPQSATV